MGKGKGGRGKEKKNPSIIYEKLRKGAAHPCYTILPEGACFGDVSELEEASFALTLHVLLKTKYRLKKYVHHCGMWVWTSSCAVNLTRDVNQDLKKYAYINL